ncbi:MAG TPA: hypothetical protein VNO52_07465 [Methylomirabilota bacterium]|nr:hypothetical protein [Methylomirabilota bacterium]
MGGSDILNQEDMERSRSPGKLRAWVNQKCKELGPTPGTKAYPPANPRLLKKFYEEIWPLAIFAHREFGDRDDVVVKPNLGSDRLDHSFDACISVGGGEPTIFVEITCAKDGYDESRRMEVLAREGSVSLIGPVLSSGRKGSADRKVRVHREARPHAEVVKKYLAMVKDRLGGKTGRRAGNGHILLVAVDDDYPLVDPSDHESLRAAAAAWLPGLDCAFGRVVFVGVADRLFISFNLAGHGNGSDVL